MTLSRPLEIGMTAWWSRVCSNYGHVTYIPVTVRKIGKRVTVEAPLKDGGTKLVAVTEGRLNWNGKNGADGELSSEAKK